MRCGARVKKPPQKFTDHRETEHAFLLSNFESLTQSKIIRDSQAMYAKHRYKKCSMDNDPNFYEKHRNGSLTLEVCQ